MQRPLSWSWSKQSIVECEIYIAKMKRCKSVALYAIKHLFYVTVVELKSRKPKVSNCQSI